MQMNWAVLWEYRAALWDGLVLTAELSSISIVGSLLLGTVIGCISTLPGFFASRIAGAYVEVIRNVPVVVKLFILYFALGLDAMPASLLALIVHQSAYISDVIASGFRSIPLEQVESARATGLSPAQTFRHVTLPQVYRLIMPPLTSQFIEVVKNSSVVMLIGLQEMTFQTQNIEAETFRGFEAATAVTVLYLVMALGISWAMGIVQRRLAIP
jgi:polar amino acid transport system permease protein